MAQLVPRGGLHRADMPRSSGGACLAEVRAQPVGPKRCVRQGCLTKTPLRDAGQCPTAVRAAMLLARDAADFITGEVLSVAGGCRLQATPRRAV